ncbi:hypothetical protein PVIIG_02681 [Plasmodium vivax India VII]|uniref:Pv-fam-d protein n=1 Tax=Plasmodium vivax India VII TaxID=1077284 RepID=A0A0J9SE06_PLAVI|nr:hypothetical protein PVIIG_02681 [Plasmodium vivax India VII]
MKEKTNKPLILSTKVFTFFLLVCTWKYPLESSSTFGKSPETRCHPRNEPAMQVGRVLIGDTLVHSSAPRYPTLKEKLIDILDEHDDEVFSKRLNALIHDEKFKKQFELLFHGGQLRKDISSLAINNEILKAAGKHPHDSSTNIRLG